MKYSVLLCRALLMPCFLAGTAIAQEKPQYLLTHKETKGEAGSEAGEEAGDSAEDTGKTDPAAEGGDAAPEPAKGSENPSAVPTTDDAAAAGDCECKPPKKPKPSSPWEFKLRLGSIFQLSSNQSVIGKADGTSRSIGADVHGEANWAGGRHEVRNRLDANVVFIRTPNTRGWVSATDVLELESIYQYRITSWMGPFLRGGLVTSMFVGRDLRTNSVEYQLPDGSLTPEQTELRLTDPFQPLTLLQTVGAFVNPVREEEFDIDFRGGIGAREVFADGQLGVQDDSDTTGIVEIVDLRSYVQAGLELIAMSRGILLEKKLQYFFGGEFLLPLLRSESDGRSSLSLIDKRIRLGIAYRVASWATLLYEIRLVHQPQLLGRYQIQNSFGFKASYSVL